MEVSSQRQALCWSSNEAAPVGAVGAPYELTPERLHPGTLESWWRVPMKSEAR